MFPTLNFEKTGGKHWTIILNLYLAENTKGGQLFVFLQLLEVSFVMLMVRLHSERQCKYFSILSEPISNNTTIFKLKRNEPMIAVAWKQVIISCKIHLWNIWNCFKLKIMNLNKFQIRPSPGINLKNYSVVVSSYS